MLTVTPLKPVSRAQVVDEAKSWIGTRYEHMGLVKGAGCDCATLISEVFANVGLIPRLQIEHYPLDWAAHRNDERYLDIVLRHAEEFSPRLSRPQPGDLALWQYKRTYSHGAIIIDWPTILETDMVRGVIINDAGMHGQRPVRFFRIRGL